MNGAMVGPPLPFFKKILLYMGTNFSNFVTLAFSSF